MTASPDVHCLIWALNTRLIASATATDTLLAWCEEHGLSDGPITVDVGRRFSPSVVPDEVLPALGLESGETLHYRQVRLMRGALARAAAENWFVPQRLTAAMNEALTETEIPFGTVIAPLRTFRRILAARVWRMTSDPVEHPPRSRGSVVEPHPEIILKQTALIRNRAGTALALVKERYFSELVSFASVPPPERQAPDEGSIRPVMQDVRFVR